MRLRVRDASSTPALDKLIVLHKPNNCASELEFVARIDEPGAVTGRLAQSTGGRRHNHCSAREAL
jgi:hypothetical protein